MIEKPICETSEEIYKLIQIAHLQHRILQIGHIVRFKSVIADIEKLLGTPLLIEPTRLEPFTSRATDDSVILDLTIHNIDLIQSLVNSPIFETSANSMPVLSDTTDYRQGRYFV